MTQDETFSYDPLGNLTQRVIGTPATATTVNVYDGANQLLEMRSGTATSGRGFSTVWREYQGELILDPTEGLSTHSSGKARSRRADQVFR